MSVTSSEIVAFWRAAGFEKWFGKSDAFDAEIRTRFEAAHFSAARQELSAWQETAEGALALVILLDQFPRNLFRVSPHAFATDPLARKIADRALAAGHDQAVDPKLRGFFYLPFEHSENLADQDRSLALFGALPDKTGEMLRYAKLHRDVIARFGRFPHRNDCLGRTSSPEEKTFLAEGGFSA